MRTGSQSSLQTLRCSALETHPHTQTWQLCASGAWWLLGNPGKDMCKCSGCDQQAGIRLNILVLNATRCLQGTASCSGGISG